MVALVVGMQSVVDPQGEMLPAFWAFQAEHGLYTNLVTLTRFALEDWRAWLIFVFAGAPTLSALVVSFVGGGRGGLGELLRRFHPVGPCGEWASAVRAYVVLLVAHVLGVALYLGWASRSGADGWQDQVLTSLGGSLPAAVFWLLAGVFLDEGGTLEELGWRGYAQGLLLDRWRSPLGATLLLGFLWWLWHFPREIPNILGSDDLSRWAFFQGVFLVLCLALSIVISYFWFKTGGSVWPALLIHGGTNVWSKALGAPLYETVGDLRTWVVVGCAVAVLALTRARLGALADAAEP
ncbi:MAG: CPBP family glutamic-type intramembrane protease [Acidobacteriota bacterium]